MKIKNNFSIIATLVLLIVLLAGCSGPPEVAPTESNSTSGENEVDNDVDLELKPEEGAELLIWGGGDEHKEWVEFVAEKFTEEYGVPVIIEDVAHTEAPAILQTDGPAGLGADVFTAPHDHVGNMETAGLIVENFFPDFYKENFMEAAILGTTIDDTLYGYPYAVENTALYYNKDLVDTVPETFEELLELSREFTDVRADKFGIMFPPNDFYFTYPFLAGYGGYVFGNDNTDPSEIGLNNEGTVLAGEFLRELREASLPLNSEDITNDIIGTLFNENQVMFRISGPWDVRPHMDAGVNFGVIPFPLLSNGERPINFSGIISYFVNAYTDYPDAAALYAKFATSEEMLEKRFEMTSQLPPHSALLESEVILSDPILSGFLEQAEYSQPMPNISEMEVVWGPMADALTSIWNSDRDVQEILDSSVDQIKESIEILNN